MAQDVSIGRMVRVLALAIVGLLASNGARAQDRPTAPSGPAPAATPSGYVAITAPQRVDWIIEGVVGPRSLGIGVIAAAWETAWNTPEEWHQSWKGFGKRYLQREADVALSSGMEAGLGAIWGEEPRYIRAPRGSVRSRFAYAVRTVVLAQRRDGRLAPAWARGVGNVLNNVVENTWLPPSATTTRQTLIRCGEGFLGRLAGNLWEEFWPDVKARLGR
jgi:hypothetical protein